jgi:hypothetical protein
MPKHKRGDRRLYWRRRVGREVSGWEGVVDGRVWYTISDAGDRGRVGAGNRVWLRRLGRDGATMSREGVKNVAEARRIAEDYWRHRREYD